MGRHTGRTGHAQGLGVDPLVATYRAAYIELLRAVKEFLRVVAIPPADFDADIHANLLLHHQALEELRRLSGGDVPKTHEEKHLDRNVSRRKGRQARPIQELAWGVDTEGR